jgi:rhodanese-related sulfurtransferase
MNELNKTTRLTIAVIAIALVFVIGLVTFQKPEVEYSITPAVTLMRLADANLMINPSQAKEFIQKNDAGIVFIDIRNVISFDRSHLDNAINIPLRELLDKSSLKLMQNLKEKGKTIIIYGETPQQASGAWMMLQQTGFQQVKMINGDYTEVNSNYEPTSSLTTEKPMIDIDALKKLTTSAPEGEVKKQDVVKKTVVPVKIETSSGGGC